MGRPRGPETSALTLRISVETYKKVMAAVDELRQTDKRQTITSWIEDACRAHLARPAAPAVQQIPMLEKPAWSAPVPVIHTEGGTAAADFERESRRHTADWWLEQLNALREMEPSEAKLRFSEIAPGTKPPRELFGDRRKLAAWLADHVC